MRYHVRIGEHTFEVDLGTDGFRLDGASVEANLAHTEGTPTRGLTMDGETYRLVADRGPRGSWKLNLRGRTLTVDVVDERSRAIRDMAGAGAPALGPRPIVAPMPGMVVKVEVAEGDVVQPGEGVVIVEAMKMENELKSTGAGRVTRVHVRRGDAVEKDQVLVELEALEGA